MDTRRTTEEESPDQPNQPSTPDQAEEESQDQPTEEIDGNDDSQDSSSEEEEEVNESPETINLDGEEYSVEEAKELLSKGKHFTYNMQQLREKERQLQSSQQPEQKQQPTEEDKEAQEVREKLKQYGLVTEEEVDAKLKAIENQRLMQSKYLAFREKYPNVTDFAARMIDGAARAWGISHEEAYERGGWGSGNSQSRSVKRKTLGAKKSATTPVSKKGGGAITRADIAKMSTEEYNKNLPRIEELIRKGELK